MVLYLSSVRCGDVVVCNLRHHGHGLAHAAHVHVLDLQGTLGRVGTSTTPMHAARAMATMPPRVFCRRNGNPRRLRNLTWQFLGLTIQDGVPSAAEDAQGAQPPLCVVVVAEIDFDSGQHEHGFLHRSMPWIASR